MNLAYDNLSVYGNILCPSQKLAAVVEVRRCRPKTPRLGSYGVKLGRGRTKGDDERKQLWRLESLYRVPMAFAPTGRNFGRTNLTMLGTRVSIESDL